jgi:hypothetical protein
MVNIPIQIEKLIQQLDPIQTDSLQSYLEYLVYVQQNNKLKATNVSGTQRTEKEEKLKFLKQFKGDAPYKMDISKFDVYEQFNRKY